jgi:uncharacterized protein VirK/YbjX
VIETDPKISFKYLGKYLSLSLSRASRLAILTHHYNTLANFVKDDFVEKIINGQIKLWEEYKGLDRYCIALTYPDYHREGDLSIVFYFNSHIIYTMSFTIAPGNLLDIPADHVLFITRMQGTTGHFDLIRHATKSLNDISPQKKLLVVIEAIATTMGISDIAGICAREQINFETISSRDVDSKTYDDFWRNHGGKIINDKLFHLPVPLTHKPISMIPINHRCRVKNKRHLNKDFMGQVCLTFSQKCIRSL